MKKLIFREHPKKLFHAKAFITTDGNSWGENLKVGDVVRYSCMQRDEDQGPSFTIVGLE